MSTLARAVISKPYRLNGAEVRFLRKHLGKTGEDFSKLLHVTKSTLSKWETGDLPVGDQSDHLIRLITAGLIDNFNKQDIIGAITHLPDIKAETSSKSILVDPQKMSYRYAA